MSVRGKNKEGWRYRKYTVRKATEFPVKREVYDMKIHMDEEHFSALVSLLSIRRELELCLRF